MNVKTDLARVKDVAITLLHTDLHIDEEFDFICHHPFFGQSVYFSRDTRELLDLNNKSQLKIARNEMENIINNVKRYSDFAMLVQKPYFPAFFKYTEEFLDKEDYGTFLSYLWTTTEFPNHDANVSVNEFMGYFKKADKEFLMTSEDHKAFSELPEKITVYRGLSLKATTKALSWTTDIEKAKWFANRFNSNGQVFSAEINKKDIFAYFATQGESEVVLNYKKLENLKEIEFERNNKEEIELE